MNKRNYTKLNIVLLVIPLILSGCKLTNQLDGFEDQQERETLSELNKDADRYLVQQLEINGQGQRGIGDGLVALFGDNNPQIRVVFTAGAMAKKPIVYNRDESATVKLTFKGSEDLYAYWGSPLNEPPYDFGEFLSETSLYAEGNVWNHKDRGSFSMAVEDNSSIVLSYEIEDPQEGRTYKDDIIVPLYNRGFLRKEIGNHYLHIRTYGY